jgi:hypothetical protein
VVQDLVERRLHGLEPAQALDQRVAGLDRLAAAPDGA